MDRQPLIRQMSASDFLSHSEVTVKDTLYALLSNCITYNMGQATAVLDLEDVESGLLLGY